MALTIGSKSVAAAYLGAQSVASFYRGATPIEGGRYPAGFYKPSGLARLRAALAASSAAQTAIIIEGDSITVGAYANDNPADSSAAAYLIFAQSGYAGQLRDLMAARYGDVGEGLLMFGTDEKRWTHTSTAASSSGPITTGRTISAGGKIEAEGVEFSRFDVACLLSALSSNIHPPRVFVDAVEATPTLLTADQRGGVVDASNWKNRGNATLANVPEVNGDGHIQVTAAANGNVSIETPAGTSGRPVTPGDVLLVTVAAQTASNARAFTAALRFYDASGVDLVSGAEANVGSKNTTPAAWVQISGVVTVPAGAAFANMILRGTSLSAAETIDFKVFDAIPVDTLASPSLRAARYGADVAAGEHDIEIRGPIEGTSEASWFMARTDTDSGVAVHRMGKSGSHTGNHAGTEYSAPTGNNMLSTMFDLIPEAACQVIMLGANDIPNQGTNGITPAVFKANLQNLIDKRVALGGCVLLVSGPRYSDDTGLTDGEESYYAKMRELADENTHVAYFDLSAQWGDMASAEANGFMDEASYGIHPKLAGHTNLASVEYRILA